MDLFRIPAVRRLGPSARWLPARLAFMIVTAGAHRARPAAPRRGA
jgi:hypothetical protein